MRGKSERKTLATETKIHQMKSIPPENVPEVGKPSSYTCAACGGPIEQIEEGTVLRFRCQVGHGFTAHALLLGRLQKSEDAIWNLVSNFMESSRLADLLARQGHKEGMPSVARKVQAIHDACKHLADEFRDLVQKIPDPTLDNMTANKKRPT